MKLEEHTPAQQEAITTKAPSVLVVAGPGSGKTATTVARIKHLIDDGVPPERIAAITFTNAAAKEMHKRLEQCEICGGAGWYTDGPTEDPQQVQCPCTSRGTLGHCGTLHSFALKMLKRFGAAKGYGERMAIISPESAQDLLMTKAQTVGCKLKIDDLMKLKAKGMPSRLQRMDLGQLAVASYYQDLRDAGIVDFDILLTEFADMLAEDANFLKHDYDYLFVDEVQDSGPVDWQIYQLLPIANKFYVGDPDQAIYGFRGGDLNGMLWMAKQPDTAVIKLEQNFRSNEEICQCAQNLIEHNCGRIAKQTISAKGRGGMISASAPAENEGHELSIIINGLRDYLATAERVDAAVLCRTNAIAYYLQQNLEAAGLPVIKRQRSSLPKDWPVLRSLIELVSNPDNDSLAFFYLVQLYQSKGASPKDARESAAAVRKAANAVGKTINQANLNIHSTRINDALAPISNESRMLLGHIIRTIDIEDPLALALAVANYHDDVNEEKQVDGIHVLTIHASKGREFDAVFLAGWEDEIIPGRAHNTSSIEEERRLAYVAVTRARKLVQITNARSRTTPWGSIAQHTPSRFIEEMVKP